MAQGFNPFQRSDPGGPIYSAGVVQDEGQVIHVTGQVAYSELNQVIGRGDARAQMIKCVENVETVLAAIGGRLGDIVSLTIYFVERDDLAAIRDVRRDRLSFAPGRAPVSVLVQVAGLADPALRVALVPIAVVPDERFKDPRIMTA